MSFPDTDLSRADEWAVTVDLLLDDDAERVAGELLDPLAPERGATASAAEGRLGITMTAWGEGPDQALRDAVSTLLEVLEKVGAKVDWPAGVAGIAVQSYEELEREEAHGGPPLLAGVAEVAAELGVSKTRVGELARTLDRFPRPLAQLASGPVWDLHAIRAFAERWHRRPGRPPATAGA